MRLTGSVHCDKASCCDICVLYPDPTLAILAEYSSNAELMSRFKIKQLSVVSHVPACLIDGEEETENQMLGLLKLKLGWTLETLSDVS